MIMEQQLTKKKPSTVVILSVLGAVLLLAIALFSVYYLYRQSRIHLKEPIGFQVSFQDTKEESETSGGPVPVSVGIPATSEEAVKIWLDTFLAQFDQPYLRSKSRLDSYSIEKIEFLDYPSDDGLPAGSFPNGHPLSAIQRLQLNFYVDPHRAGFIPFDTYGDMDEGKDIHLIQWVVTLSWDETTKLLSVTDIVRPAAYQLEDYQSSGQAELDEEASQYREERMPENPGTDTFYKIAEQVLSVTYDGGTTWCEVPLSMDEVNNYAYGGHLTLNALQEGSYVIAKEKTAFAYGGGSNDLRVVYSNDAGVTWNTSIVTDFYTLGPGYDGYIRVRYCSFPTPDLGYVVIGCDKTMSAEAQHIWETQDGGKTWQMSGQGPFTTLICDANFVAPSTGFISYHYVEGSEFSIYRTEDAGATWEGIPITLDPDLVPYLTLFRSPRWEGDHLVFTIDEGPDSDYPAPNPVHAKYISDDLGKTWQYQGLIEESTSESSNAG